MATITLNRTVDGTLTSTTDGESSSPLIAVYLSDSTATFGIKLNSSGATVVAPTSAITATSSGVYDYDVSALAAGSYTVVWKITAGSVTSYITQTFSIDDAVAVVDGCTLADIERETAYRLGPFIWETAASGSTGSVIITAFRSSLSALDNVQDLYILRRGFNADGTAVVGFNSADRIRLVASIETSTGAVTPDRSWANAPAAGESIEFHHLHPQRELRKAVLEGLKRCYSYDTTSIVFTAQASERDLTASVPWIRRRQQVANIQINYQNSYYIPQEAWFNAFEKTGHVWIRAARDPYPNSMVVTAIRPAFTYVNNSNSNAGPDDDDDIIKVDVNYAAAAAHCEAYRRFAYALTAASQTGLQTSKKEASSEFTRQTMQWCPLHPQRIQLSYPMGYYGPELP